VLVSNDVDLGRSSASLRVELTRNE
jgi:hypothetical protein